MAREMLWRIGRAHDQSRFRLGNARDIWRLYRKPMLNSNTRLQWRCLVVILLALSFTTDCFSQNAWETTDARNLKRLNLRVPGEFEHQDAILLGANGLIEDNSDLFVNLIRNLRGKTAIVLMVTGLEQAEKAKWILEDDDLPTDILHIAEVQHDTMWARDYGPIVAMSRNREAVFVDAFYSFDRTCDDATPAALARLLGKASIGIPLRIDGGNLLFNGSGLAITTERFWEENSESSVDDETTLDALNQAYGVKRLVTLEPLFEEPTGHVDMFATFVSRKTVVVGQYDPNVDPVNAEILDRNAAALESVVFPDGPLRVVRIPMPERSGETWRTYTNVIYANGVILVPNYPDIAEPGLLEALATYKRLLPQWKIVPIDASNIISSCGALHCISMNLAGVGGLPEFPQVNAHQATFEETFEMHSDRSEGNDAFDEHARWESNNYLTRHFNLRAWETLSTKRRLQTLDYRQGESNLFR